METTPKTRPILILKVRGSPEGVQMMTEVQLLQLHLSYEYFSPTNLGSSALEW